jgi:hypothetical protein
MPNTEVVQLWVAALRSGKYKQTVGRLQRRRDYVGKYGDEYTAGFCCLGVLCDLAVQAGVAVTTEDSVSALNGDPTVAYNGEVNMPPQVVLEWAGLGATSNPHVKHQVTWAGVDADGEELEPEWQEDPLTILNDDYKLGFLAIADAIERTYLADSLAGQPA